MKIQQGHKTGGIMQTKTTAKLFPINNDLLTQARATLSNRGDLYWLVGGAGSGKTTICQTLSSRFDLPVYDMDARIYGSYHGRFTTERHPVNKAWSSAPDGLAWLLDMSWEEFNSFNQAALPEYLDLLAQELDSVDQSSAGILIDGGICNPALLAQVIPPGQIVCLARPDRSSKEIWEENDQRIAMREIIYQLPNPEAAWQKFLVFDGLITRTILQECQESQIAVVARSETEGVSEFAERVAAELGIGRNLN